MGLGRFKDGKFDVLVSFDGMLTDDEWFAWERAFEKASELLFNATEGQGQFGRIYACDEAVGRATADYVVHVGSGTSTNRGRLGDSGSAINTFRLGTTNQSNATHGVLMLIHELAHHVWDLGDERTGRWLTLTIDTSTTPADRSRIPIDPGQADWDGTPLGQDSLLQPTPRRRRAVLRFTGADGIERKKITTHNDREVTVDALYSKSPIKDQDGDVWIDDQGECGNQSTDDYCIMETVGSGAGTFSVMDALGVWQPAANPVTEFCSASNHDPDGNTGQEYRHSESCWETIISTPGFTHWNMPDPASAVQPSGHVEPEWVVLDKQPRFVLVLDRSGSMGTGNKMDDAKHGAIFWLERAAQGNDRLAILWYDHALDQTLGLTEVSGIGNLQQIIDDINTLAPRGATNMREGLREAQNQIESLNTRAAVQVALLLTDGIHNTPFGSSPMEVVEDFQEGGIRIYSLGVGPEGSVDMETLETLSNETGGRAYQVGDNNPGEIESRMVEISTEVREGLVTTVPSLMPEPEPSSDSSQFDQLIKQATANGKHPHLKDLMKVLSLKKIEELLKPDKRLQGKVVAIPADIEKESHLASFSLVHPKTEDVWLYLVDPKGDIVDMTAPSVRHVISPAPHEFALVQKPLPGRWWILAVRGKPGSKTFAFYTIAGSRNLHVTVLGGATAHVLENQPVRLWAVVRWDELLSNVLVKAVINGPDGKKHTVILRDEKEDEPQSGEYEGLFIPKNTGRYHGMIHIHCRSRRAVLAQGMQRLLHDEKAEKLSLRTKAPNFVRVVPFTFEVGQRKTPEDSEKRDRLTDRYRRRRPARRSAKS